MEKNSNPIITAECPLFACRECRTKSEWPHQRWCHCAQVVRPACGDCVYWKPEAGVCKHPVRRKAATLRERSWLV